MEQKELENGRRNSTMIKLHWTHHTICLLLRHQILGNFMACGFPLFIAIFEKSEKNFVISI